METSKCPPSEMIEIKESNDDKDPSQNYDSFDLRQGIEERVAEDVNQIDSFET